MAPGERAATRAIARAVSLRATVPAFGAVALRPDRANVSRRAAALGLRALLDDCHLWLRFAWPSIHASSASTRMNLVDTA